MRQGSVHIKITGGRLTIEEVLSISDIPLFDRAEKLVTNFEIDRRKRVMTASIFIDGISNDS